MLVVHFEAFPRLLFSESPNISQICSVRRWSSCRARAAGTTGESEDKKLKMTTRRMRRWTEGWQMLSIIVKTMKTTMIMIGTLPHLNNWTELLNHTWYLSFFLHGQNFWRIRFTLKKTRKLRQNTQKIANLLRYYGKIHSKLPIFRVKSVKIYIDQKIF